MPLGRINVAATGAWMVCSGGYLRSLGESVPAGAGAVARPRPAVDGPGSSIRGARDAGVSGICARAVAATRRILRKVFIADLRFCAPAAWAAAERSEEHTSELQ